MVTGKDLRLGGAEQRLQGLGITLPAPPEPFGAYMKAVHNGLTASLQDQVNADLLAFLQS